MQKFVLSCLAATVFIQSGQAQTLFTYGKETVTKQEFLRNYEKNTVNKKVDFSEAALRDYINLYALFKMKVKEAEQLKLDTMPAIQSELNNYRRQLAKNYLTDKQISDKLLMEAYERSKQDRRVAHILITAPATMSPADTLIRFKRIDSIYNALVKNKADFATLAKIYSDDAGSKNNGGDIGYMTSLQTMYAFENEVYNTAPGKVSKPFRTSLGYDIVKVLDARPARGEIKIAQILFAAPLSQGEAGRAEAKAEATKVYEELKHGAPFEVMVKEHSDDQYTKAEGGVMQFGVGSMVSSFEDAAFALNKPGEISQPILTDFGYHIIKLIEKYPLKPFDSVSNSLKRTIEKDARSQVAKTIYLDKVKQKSGYKEYPANFQEVLVRVKQLSDTGKSAGNFTAKEFASMVKPVFTLDKVNYTQSDLMGFAEMLTRGKIMGNRENTMNDIFKIYLDKVLNDYQEHKLEDENVDFKNLMKEYRDGIMLFDLMDRNVWSKSSKDSMGLMNYYEANKSKFMWEPGFKGSVYQFKDEATWKKGMKLLEAKNKPSNEDFIKQMNDEKNPDAVRVQSGHFEFSKFTDAPKSALIAGTTTKGTKNADGTYTVVKTDEVLNAPSQKSLDDARGYVVAEYQDFLEKQWNANLRSQYPMKIDEATLKSMTK
ncbi:MAG TPA: peptidylprolyl isomerase [Flavipsychrobacter sp.]|nr:peptidylprolyl isomerase [Flavipsychrobacter sp.]